MLSKVELVSNVACGFAFDLGRAEALRAEAMARVRFDWWLERGSLLAEVSTDVLLAEVRRRLALESEAAYQVQTGGFPVPAASRDVSDDE